MSDAKNEHRGLKLLLLGDRGVGKSCLSLRLCEDSYTDSYITSIGVDFRNKTLNVGGKDITLQVFDTAGGRINFSQIAATYGTVHGVLLVYDVTDRGSYNYVKKLLEQPLPRNCKAMLIAAKEDRMLQEAQIPNDEASEFARQHGMQFFTVSAKTGMKVTEAFSALAEELITSEQEQEKRAIQAQKIEQFKKDALNKNKKIPNKDIKKNMG